MCWEPTICPRDRARKRLCSVSLGFWGRQRSIRAALELCRNSYRDPNKWMLGGRAEEGIKKLTSELELRGRLYAPLGSLQCYWQSPRFGSSWSAHQCPDEWIKKLWYIYTMEYYSAVKKIKILPFTTVWIDLESTLLSEVSQSEKDKYHMISLICGL